MSPPLADIRAAMAVEVLARRAGTCLFVWNGQVYTLRPSKMSAHLRELCGRYEHAIKWLCEARASE